MAKPPDDHIPKNDRSVWKGLVVEATEFAPPKPSPIKWVLVVVVLAAAAAAVVFFLAK